MYLPPWAYVRLVQKYSKLSDEQFGEIVLPLYAEVVYRKHGYAHARHFRTKALAARRIYKRAARQYLRSQRRSERVRAKGLAHSAQSNSGHARAPRRASGSPGVADFAPERGDQLSLADPEPLPHSQTLRKIVGIHSCAECACDGQHSLVRLSEGN